jgi:epoxyqueuosine reductase
MFRKLFSKTSIKRTGRDRFVRNVLIAIGNSKNPREVSTVESLLDDPSSIVRGAAVWALFQLVCVDRFLDYRKKRFSQEKVVHVQNEWDIALK